MYATGADQPAVVRVEVNIFKAVPVIPVCRESVGRFANALEVSDGVNPEQIPAQELPGAVNQLKKLRVMIMGAAFDYDGRRA